MEKVKRDGSIFLTGKISRGERDVHFRVSHWWKYFITNAWPL